MKTIRKRFISILVMLGIIIAMYLPFMGGSIARLGTSIMMSQVEERAARSSLGWSDALHSEYEALAESKASLAKNSNIFYRQGATCPRGWNATINIVTPAFVVVLILIAASDWDEMKKWARRH